jgi:hypothetical protein
VKALSEIAAVEVLKQKKISLIQKKECCRNCKEHHEREPTEACATSAP